MYPEQVDLSQITVADLTDTVGAVNILKARFHREDYSVDSLHQLVKHGKIRSFMFQDGKLVLRKPDEKTRGRDLFLLRSDIEQLPEPRRGRPVTKK